MVRWKSELRIVISVMTRRKFCIGVDTMIWRIGCFSAESVWLTLNRALGKPTNTVAHGRVRRGEFQVWSVTVQKRITSRVKSVVINFRLAHSRRCGQIMFLWLTVLRQNFGTLHHLNCLNYLLHIFLLKETLQRHEKCIPRHSEFAWYTCLDYHPRLWWIK